MEKSRNQKSLRKPSCICVNLLICIGVWYQQNSFLFYCKLNSIFEDGSLFSFSYDVTVGWRVKFTVLNWMTHFAGGFFFPLSVGNSKASVISRRMGDSLKQFFQEFSELEDQYILWKKPRVIKDKEKLSLI